MIAMKKTSRIVLSYIECRKAAFIPLLLPDNVRCAKKENEI
jgi:hypothetical protein